MNTHERNLYHKGVSFYQPKVKGIPRQSVKDTQAFEGSLQGTDTLIPKELFFT